MDKNINEKEKRKGYYAVVMQYNLQRNIVIRRFKCDMFDATVNACDFFFKLCGIKIY